LLLFEFLTNIRISIAICYFRLFESLKYIQKYLFKVKYFCKNFKKKIIYNIYKTKEILEFTIKIGKNINYNKIKAKTKIEFIYLNINIIFEKLNIIKIDILNFF